jgi:quercetin dioxygenase-like cupin family protein
LERRKLRIIKVSDLREFPIFGNIFAKIVFHSDKVMFLLVEIPPKGNIPEHSHPHEQMGLCLKGKVEFRSEKESKLIENGMFYWIKPGEKHSVRSLVEKPCLFLDVFNPPREDYIEKAMKYNKA